MKKYPKKTTVPSLRIVRCVRSPKDNSQLENLVNIAWLFAYSTLWNNNTFSTNEKEEAKICIKELIAPAKSPRKAFLNFCQRIVLARQHVKSISTNYLALPSLWLDQDTPEGYASTRELMEEIKTIRYSLPNYRVELKALSEAILEVSEEPTRENFLFWRNYFIDKQEAVLQNLFSVYCANFHFNIS